MPLRGKTKFTEIRFIHKDGNYSSISPNPKLIKMIEDWIDENYSVSVIKDIKDLKSDKGD